MECGRRAFHFAKRQQWTKCPGDVNALHPIKAGYAGALKYAFGPQSYARLVAALGTNLDSLTDSQIVP